ncbi:DUF937 domain-containing protein [Pseudonocardia pini]|uniref:DUF937 domain-containing protein n=1 Tax=Pseudonocardia pini TaxID=2758030 RepID=UPI0015F0B512|nr:DUF937 domain-containing protein [Pseudonocardia pini]
MSPVDDILAQVPLGDLAARLGVDEATAEHAARQALPALLGGIQANADDPAGAASFASAVQQHDEKLIDGGVDLGQVDTSDGEKIVSHVFGAQKDTVVNQLGGIGALGAPASGAAPQAQAAFGGGEGGSGLIAKLLPILAPIVMSYLAKKLSGGSAGNGGLPGSGAGAGGGLGDLLGGILGGAGGQGGQGGGVLGGGLGDLLGGLLGGGRK